MNNWKKMLKVSIFGGVVIAGGLVGALLTTPTYVPAVDEYADALGKLARVLELSLRFLPFGEITYVIYATAGVLVSLRSKSWWWVLGALILGIIASPILFSLAMSLFL